jgi:hypothetical protein
VVRTSTFSRSGPSSSLQARQATTPSERDRRPGRGVECEDLRDDRRQIGAGRPDVAAALPAVHFVAKIGEEASDRDSRPVVGAEPEQDDHGMPRATRRGRQEW